MSSDECANYRAICDSSGQNKIHSWIASTSDHQAPECDSTCTESLHGTDGQEKNPCDEARDCWENKEGRWVRVHSVARRTLFDPMHDEQPFCHNLTERRRTTVRFLGQQSEMMIDDTWPQAGEMRSVCVKSIPPATENWLRKLYKYSKKSYKSTEDKHETNHINNKCNDMNMNTRKMHNT